LGGAHDQVLKSSGAKEQNVRGELLGAPSANHHRPVSAPSRLAARKVVLSRVRQQIQQGNRQN
jgi:hypothetical protein